MNCETSRSWRNEVHTVTFQGQRNILPFSKASTNDLRASMTDRWNMSMEYFWNNSERVKPNFLGQEMVPESHYPPQIPYRVSWLARREVGGITLALCRNQTHIFLIQKQHGPSKYTTLVLRQPHVACTDITSPVYHEAKFSTCLVCSVKKHELIATIKHP
jgi:hypothetical protein